jgi:hypothetical protein
MKSKTKKSCHRHQFQNDTRHTTRNGVEGAINYHSQMQLLCGMAIDRRCAVRVPRRPHRGRVLEGVAQRDDERVLDLLQDRALVFDVLDLLLLDQVLLRHDLHRQQLLRRSAIDRPLLRSSAVAPGLRTKKETLTG